MLLLDNQAIVPYSAGTIQMVPGSLGYEPASRNADANGSALMQSGLNARSARSEALDPAYQTLYDETRRLTTYGQPEVGSFIDIYA